MIYFMIRFILILLVVLYIFWIFYKLISNDRDNQKQLPLNIIIPVFLIFTLGLLAFFLLPKFGIFAQKLLPIFYKAIIFSKMIIQKIIPILNFLRGIVPI